MNPFRTDASAGSDLNRTEIELAKIREREETKRRVIEARELTKQKSEGYWVVRGLAVAALSLSVLIGAIATYNIVAEREQTKRVDTKLEETKAERDRAMFDAM